MAANLFGQLTEDDIRVGYIDPSLGYVSNVSKCQANAYAKKNPGTVFLFIDGSRVLRYLSINEVNSITVSDLVSNSNCGGISQKYSCGVPFVQFYGGGGIGAEANPIIGRDGSLLAVDLVRSGNGYQFPPQVIANDVCEYGSGAVLTSVLGEIADGFETYDTEEDFEEYELCEPEFDSYGESYDSEGNIVSDWNPRSYTRATADPLKAEIRKYEEVIRKTSRRPFWSTQSYNPNRITSTNPNLTPGYHFVSNPNRTDTVVEIPGKGGSTITAIETVYRGNVWSDFLNRFGISPYPPSNVIGSDYAGNTFIWEWDIDFPVTGNYRFRGHCDNIGGVFIDDEFVGNLDSGVRFDAIPDGPAPPVTKLFRNVQRGVHKVRLELFNVPSGPPLSPSPNSWNANPMAIALAIDAPEPVVPKETIAVRQEGRCPNNPIWTTRFPTNGQSWYPVNFYGYKEVAEEFVPDKNAKTISDREDVVFEIYGEGGKDIRNLSFTFVSSDNKDSFVLRGVDKSKQTIKKTISIRKNVRYRVIAKENDPKYKKVEQGIIKSGTKAKEGGTGESNKIFADYLTSANDNDDIQIKARKGKFTASDRKGIGRSTYDLVYVLEGSSSPSGQIETKISIGPSWSKFMNRYAISPIKPLDTPGSDLSGITYSTSWNIDIPYDGFYGLRGTRDNTGRILIDGREVSKLDGFSIETPSIEKVFLTKGRHTITAEVYNTPIQQESVIEKKIFRTKDWQAGPPADNSGTNSSSVDFKIKTNAKNAIGIEINGLLSESKRYDKKQLDIKKTLSVEFGKVYNVKIVGKNIRLKIDSSGKKVRAEDSNDFDWNDIVCSVTKGEFFDLKGNKCKFRLKSDSSPVSLVGGGTIGGVTYSGPKLFAHKQSTWSEFMNSDSVSPFLPPLDDNNPEINGVKEYRWSGIKFPETGQYEIAFQSDNRGELFIGDTKVLDSRNFSDLLLYDYVNVTEGTYDILVKVDNKPERTAVFNSNPTGFAIIIKKQSILTSSNTTPWSQNPVGISALLIPPPCPKKLSGKGVVTDVEVIDPGNGYLPPVPEESTYPVSLILDRVEVVSPGINYTGDEQFVIGGGAANDTNGIVIEPVFGPFGSIDSVKVINGGFGITEYPQISLPSRTGVNATFRPVLVPVRDPITPDPEKLIQVTDLVGLKQTGYLDGRSYYGAVFYKDGIRYAGYYETPGELVQIYDTLQESIDAQVTTPPSAVIRQGTDIASNDPRLNIPNTPENLI